MQMYDSEVDRLPSVALQADISRLSLADIVKTIPSECFQKNYIKGWTIALVNVLILTLGFYGLATFPWYAYPVCWVITGTGLAGMFMLGHDCGHYLFGKQRWVNDLVGHIVMTPLLYPFYGWVIEHNIHHANTNKVGGPRWNQVHEISHGKADPIWHPLRPEVYTGFLKPLNRWIYRVLRGSLWWLAPIQNTWIQLTFDISNLDVKEQRKIKTSRAAVIIFAAIMFPLLIATTGVWGFVKFWFIPWLGYHFWFSTFTLIHHTAPDTVWKTSKDWRMAEAQLCGTIHCNYPRWVEFLCFDINYHVPHHVTPAIPFYNLRLAYKSLKQIWTPYIRECDFSWSLIKGIITQCHLFNAETGRYLSFEELQQRSSESSTIS